jgi:hypothetical protein
MDNVNAYTVVSTIARPRGHEILGRVWWARMTVDSRIVVTKEHGEFPT